MANSIDFSIHNDLFVNILNVVKYFIADYCSISLFQVRDPDSTRHFTRNDNYGVQLRSKWYSQGQKYTRKNRLERVTMISHWSQTLSRRCSHVGSRFTSSSSSFCSSQPASSPSSFWQSCLDSRGSRVPRPPTKNSKDSVDSRHAPSGTPIDRLFLLLDTDPSGFNWFRSARPYEKGPSFKLPPFFSAASCVRLIISL